MHGTFHTPTPHQGPHFPFRNISVHNQHMLHVAAIFVAFDVLVQMTSQSGVEHGFQPTDFQPLHFYCLRQEPRGVKMVDFQLIHVKRPCLTFSNAILEARM